MYDAIGGNSMSIEAKKSDALSEKDFSGVSGGWVGVRMKKPVFGKEYKVYEVYDDNTDKLVTDFRGKDAAQQAKEYNLQHNSGYYGVQKTNAIEKTFNKYGLPKFWK